MSSDPRKPNYRGVKCKGCGERLPFLLTDLCSYCQHEKDQKETAELRELLRECLPVIEREYYDYGVGSFGHSLPKRIQEKINE